MQIDLMAQTVHDRINDFHSLAQKEALANEAFRPSLRLATGTPTIREKANYILARWGLRFPHGARKGVN